MEKVGIKVKIPSEEKIRKEAKEKGISVEIMAKFYAIQAKEWWGESNTKHLLTSMTILSLLLKKKLITHKEYIEEFVRQAGVATKVEEYVLDFFPWMKAD